MSTLVVMRQGAMLRCRGGQVLVEHEQEMLDRMPQVQVERVLLLGGVGMTTGFLQFALERRVPVTFLTQYGQYRGRLDVSGRRDIALRLAQYRGLEDTAWRMNIARPLISAKLYGQRHLLLRSYRNHRQPELAAAAEELAAIQAGLGKATTLPELMGRESRAARVYFHALPHALRKPMPFQGRSRRPPRDPVNALLSLGYGFLTAEIIGALLGVGLDPQIGILHSSRGRMPALAEDLLELFRAPVADALALALINLAVLQAEDFTPTEEGGYLLTKAGMTLFLKQYRRRMVTLFQDRNGVVTSFRRSLQSHTAHLRHVILREEMYQPFHAPLGGPVRSPKKVV